jgi:Uma2 family endonuclease
MGATDLYSLLRAACPSELKVYYAPFDVELTARAITQTDLLVTRRSDVRRRGITVAPLLAVEILSPSTSKLDLSLKRWQYEEAGCPSYWLVDPREPSIVALELLDGAFVEIGRASGEESLSLTSPFPVTVVPARLLD